MRNHDRTTGYGNLFGAVRAAIVDRFSNRGTTRAVPEHVRIDNKVCLITGSNSGLGKAVAIDLAKRGGYVLMACRGGHPEAGEEVKRLSGSDKVAMLPVDLADLQSVHGLCDALKHRVDRVDIAVLNAGLMPRVARRSRQGYELMFAVHFLANRVLIGRLLCDGLIRPPGRSGETPRIVIVASEAHRSATPIDFGRFGVFTDYGLKDGPEILRAEQVAPVHLCAGAVAQVESRRRGARRGEFTVSRASEFQHRARGAGIPEAIARPGHATALRNAAESRRTRYVPVLRRGNGSA